MKSIRPSTLGFALALASLGLGNAGCADSESMIYVRQVQARLQSGTTACTADNSPTSPALGSGVLDVQYRSQYTAALLVGSQLVPRGSSTDLRTETARVMIEGTIVHALDDSGNVIWGPVSVPGSGFIEPATDTTPSYGLTETTLFQADAALFAELQTTRRERHMTAVVKVFGKTLGGTEIESGEWQFPLSVCFRCLIAFPDGASLSAVPPGDCNAVADTATAIPSPCNPGQDDTLDCRACKAVFQNSDACQPQ